MPKVVEISEVDNGLIVNYYTTDKITKQVVNREIKVYLDIELMFEEVKRWFSIKDI